MEFLLDTANLAEIKKYVAIAPIAGVTSNPTIVKKEGQIDFFNHMKAIRDIIGLDKTLHVQVVAQDVAGIVADAHAILANIDKEVYVKVPVFSFSKLTKVDIQLGPEMKSTGESILFIDDLKDDQFYELYSRRKMYLSK